MFPLPVISINKGRKNYENLKLSKKKEKKSSLTTFEAFQTNKFILKPSVELDTVIALLGPKRL
jgi:hypothetical protein